MQTKPLKSFISKFMTLGFLWLAVSCAHTKTYVEPAGPSESLATLFADAPIWLRSIDGQKISNRGFDERRQLKVKPGKHVVEISLAGKEWMAFKPTGRTVNRFERVHVSSAGSTRVEFMAEPGKTYWANHDRPISAWSTEWRPVIREFHNYQFQSLEP